MSSLISANIARNVNVSKIQEVQYISGSTVALGHVHLIAFAGERKRPFCSFVGLHIPWLPSLTDAKMRRTFWIRNFHMLGILKEAKVGKAEKFGHGNSKIGCLAPCHSILFLNYTISKVGYILSLNAKALLMLFSNDKNI